MTGSYYHAITRCLTVLLMSSCATAALAQNATRSTASRPEPGPGGADGGAAFGEIVVTAQKRSESILAVPITMSAFDNAALTRNYATTLENLAIMIPSVQLSTAEGKAQISIRGIGNQFIIGATEAAVATHIDGFYVARQSGLVGNFLDVERVEVLKGPQGTLYGRNATSGTVNIINNKPTNEFMLRASADTMFIDRGDGTGHGTGVKASLVANLPVNDRIRMRFALMKVNRDGYVRRQHQWHRFKVVI